MYCQLCLFKTKYAQFVFVLDFMLSYNTAVAFKRYVPEQTNPHPIQEVLDRNQLAFGIQRGPSRPNVDFWAESVLESGLNKRLDSRICVPRDLCKCLWL